MALLHWQAVPVQPLPKSILFGLRSARLLSACVECTWIGGETSQGHIHIHIHIHWTHLNPKRRPRRTSGEYDSGWVALWRKSREAHCCQAVDTQSQAETRIVSGRGQGGCQHGGQTATQVGWGHRATRGPEPQFGCRAALKRGVGAIGSQLAGGRLGTWGWGAKARSAVRGEAGMEWTSFSAASPPRTSSLNTATFQLPPISGCSSYTVCGSMRMFRACSNAAGGVPRRRAMTPIKVCRPRHVPF